MRRAALLSRRAGDPPRTQIAGVRSVPAPIGGWNTRDALAQMSSLDAVTLQNWFPRTTDVMIRGGASAWATGFAKMPKTIMLYTPPTAANKMFAATDDGIFDVTSAGAIGATVKAVTNGYWNWFQMGVSGGHFLLSFNGVDKPVYFNGTTWTSIDGASTPAITGPTTTNLISGAIFKRRLFLIEKNKLSFWFCTAVDSVGGTFTEFLLGPLCSKGGFLQAIGTWSVDGGSGPDDYCVFATSEGEVIVFKGTDPGDSTAWALVGVYRLNAKPIGYKCLIKYDGDLLLITELGVIPLARALQSSTVQYTLAITNKIDRAFIEAASSYKANVGWEATLYAAQNALLVNIPTGSSTSEQFVMNTITKSWCSFTGWNAHAFAVFNGDLYFADQDKISKAWTGTSDYGANIIAQAQCAYMKFGQRGADFKMFRPLLAVDGGLSFSVGLAVDFQTPNTLSPASYSVTSGAVWDTSLWDSSFWAASLEIKNEWQQPSAKMGYWAGGVLRVDTNSLTVQWMSNDYMYEVGGILS